VHVKAGNPTLSKPLDCREWDRRGQSKRSVMAMALPVTLLILGVSIVLGGACLYSQKQLQSLPRARQSPSDWLEESGARNQVKYAGCDALHNDTCLPLNEGRSTRLQQL
jgi:hypothetical protein